MKDTILERFTCFLSGLLVGIILSYFNCPEIHTTKPEEVVNTNAFVQVVDVAETNRASSTTPQVDWFKDNSNYIWDGWKIK